MTIRPNACPTLTLSNSRFEQPLTIDMEAFFTFSFDMSERLLDLEAKYDKTSLTDAAAQLATWM